MSATASTHSDARTVRLRGRAYPVVLPTLADPRLHLAAIIVSLHVIGQVALGFDLSIAQILVSLGVCAVLEMAIAFRRQGVVLWPASALLTGNGIAFILRVPGTEHGDWWSMRGWWIFAAASAVAILAKHLIRFRGRHVFNPSNIGLVFVFLALSETVAEPLDFWWGPMSVGLALALALIVAGGFVILGRVRLVGLAVGFWLAFAAGIGVLALSGHAMTARWHVGPIEGGELWRILVFSPEILVFLFFMITDPRTVPVGRHARWAFGVSVGLLAVLLIAPLTTEYWSKVAVLGALALVSAARPLIELGRSSPSLASTRVAWSGRLHDVRLRPTPSRWATLGALGLAAAAGFAGLVVLAGIPARPDAQGTASAPTRSGDPPEIVIVRSEGVAATLDDGMAQDIVASARASLGAELGAVDRVQITLERGLLQGPPVVLATLEGTFVGATDAPAARTLELVYADEGFTVIGERDPPSSPSSAEQSGGPTGETPTGAPSDGEEPSGAEGKNWVERSICAQASADFDDVAPPPMGTDLAAYACDGVGLTGQQLETQAAAVCVESIERLALLSPATEGEIADDGAAHWRAVSRVENERALSLGALRTLDPPESYLLPLSSAIEAHEQLSELALAASDAAAAGDGDLLAQHQAAYAERATELGELWTGLGVTGCPS